MTAVVTSEGVYTFMLATDSTDGMNMSSRESATNRPELVIYIGDGSAQAGALDRADCHLDTQSTGQRRPFASQIRSLVARFGARLVHDLV